MKVNSAERSREVAGRAMRLHYEMAGLVSRYGELPTDLRPTVTQLFVDGVSVFTNRCRARVAQQQVQATADMARAFGDMQTAAAVIRPRLTAMPVHAREHW
jgi:hypothetical protein